MKCKVINISILILAIFALSCHSPENVKINEIEKPEFGIILDSFKLEGSILIFDNNDSTYYSNNFDRAKEGFLPASTFKIPNSIIAIETGIIENDSTIIKWNGEKRRLKIWEKDLTFKEAFQVSCVPCYQEIAEKIGLERMKYYLNKFEYKDMIFDSLTLNKFWLEGNSKISQLGQIEFLRRFYFSKLPVSDRTVKIVKNIMQAEKTDAYTLSGKTGWGIRNGKDIGWYVGFLETDDKKYFFATNVIPKGDLDMDDFASVRITVTKEAFKRLRLIK